MKDIAYIDDDKKATEELMRQTNSFSLHDFYMGNADYGEVSNAAIGIITPNQTVFGYSTDKHDYTAEKMYDLLYEDFYTHFKECDYEFRNVGERLNVICLQLISKFYSLVWIPEKVNEYQLSQLIDFTKNIREINNDLKVAGSLPVVITASGYNTEPLSIEDAIVKLSHNLTDETIGKERILEKANQKF